MNNYKKLQGIIEEMTNLSYHLGESCEEVLVELSITIDTWRMEIEEVIKKHEVDNTTVSIKKALDSIKSIRNKSYRNTNA